MALAWGYCHRVDHYWNHGARLYKGATLVVLASGLFCNRHAPACARSTGARRLPSPCSALALLERSTIELLFRLPAYVYRGGLSINAPQASLVFGNPSRSLE